MISKSDFKPVGGPVKFTGSFEKRAPGFFPDSRAKFHPEELGTTAELDEVAPRNSKPVVKKKYVGNPWQEADQLAFTSVVTRAEVGTMKKNNTSRWLGQDLNLGSWDFKSGALTTQLGCLQFNNKINKVE